MRLVLSEHHDLQISGVDDVAQGKVNEAVDPTERYCRLRAVLRKRHEPLTFTSGENNGQNLRVCFHIASLCEKVMNRTLFSRSLERVYERGAGAR